MHARGVHAGALPTPGKPRDTQGAEKKEREKEQEGGKKTDFDGVVRTKGEFLAKYRGSFREWDQAPWARGSPEWEEEKKVVDHLEGDGVLRTAKEFYAKYGGWEEWREACRQSRGGEAWDRQKRYDQGGVLRTKREFWIKYNGWAEWDMARKAQAWD